MKIFICRSPAPHAVMVEFPDPVRATPPACPAERKGPEIDAVIRCVSSGMCYQVPVAPAALVCVCSLCRTVSDILISFFHVINLATCRATHDINFRFACGLIFAFRHFGSCSNEVEAMERIGKDNVFVRSLLLFISFAYTTKCASSVVKGLVALASGTGPLIGCLVFVLLETSNFVYVAYGARQAWNRTFSPQRSADWTLGWSAFFGPASFLTAHYSGALPGFILHPNFLAIHAWVSLIAATVLPPAHALTHWAISSPALL